MLGKFKNGCFLFLLCTITIASCKKDDEADQVSQKAIPYYDEIPTVIVENYINRMFIDLVGREPLDSEMVYYVDYLRQYDLSMTARDSIALKLQTDTTPRTGEISYKHAYYHWFYERLKADVLESATTGDFEEKISQIRFAALSDSLNGDTSRLAFYNSEIRKMENVINAEADYREGRIGFRDMLSYMVNNQIYDMINMNTFNFINAIFDNLFFRMPTQHEFYTSFDIIEYNKAGIILGKSAQNKDDFIDVLVDSREFYNGMILRGYLKLMVREATSAETSKAMQELYFDNDYQKFQRKLIITDEYAQFKPTYR